MLKGFYGLKFHMYRTPITQYRNKLSLKGTRSSMEDMVLIAKVINC